MRHCESTQPSHPRGSRWPEFIPNGATSIYPIKARAKPWPPSPGWPTPTGSWRLNLKGELPDDDISAIESLVDHEYVAPSVRAGLYFALGAVMDARGSFARAAACFETANRVQATARAAQRQPYDPDAHSRFIDGLITRFSAEFLDRRRGWGDPDRRPVFVVGLPRSGTTLVEQILASHSQVHGAGELEDVHQLFHALPELVGQPAALRSPR